MLSTGGLRERRSSSPRWEHLVRCADRARGIRQRGRCSPHPGWRHGECVASPQPARRSAGSRPRRRRLQLPPLRLPRSGESSGDIGALHLHNRSPRMPRRQPVMHDLGIDDLVLVGACFSARTALSAAPSIRGVRAVVMATPPVGGYGREDAMAERLSREWSWSDYVRRASGDADQPGQPSHRQAYTRFARFKLRGAARRPRAATPRCVGEPEACSPGDHGGARDPCSRRVYGDRTRSSVNGRGPKPGRLGTILRAQATWSMWWTTSLGWCTASLGSASRTGSSPWRSTGSGQRCPPPARADGGPRPWRPDHGDEIRPQASPKPGSTVTVSACISHQPVALVVCSPLHRRDAAQLPARCC